MIRCRWLAALRALATLAMAMGLAPFAIHASSADASRSAGPSSVGAAASAATEAQSTVPPTYAGRPLGEALRLLQAQGVNVVFSTELVRSDMRVGAEPRAASPRRLLDEILAPHGLEARSGPRGTLLVVRTTAPARARPESDTPAVKPTPKGPPGSVSGRVIDAGSGAPLPGVLVEVQALAGIRASTDAHGLFRLAEVPAGPQSLFVSLIGFTLARPAVTVPASGVAEIVVPLVNGVGTYTEQVAVSGDSGGMARRLPAPSQQQLGRAQIETLRSVLADDPIRAVQALPGVAAGDDFHADFSVRGADLGHIGMSVDGVMTPFLLHTAQRGDDTGSVALLNADVVDRMSLTSGSYASQYGNRTGAWLETALREGTRSRRLTRGLISGSGMSVVGEGPLGADPRGSWLGALRMSHLGWLMDLVEDDAPKSGFGFVDFQSKTVYDLSPRHQLQSAVVVGHTFVEEVVAQDAEGETPAVPAMPGNGHTGLLFTTAVRSTFGSSLLLSQRMSSVLQRSSVIENEQETEKAGFYENAYRADVSWAPRPGALVDAGFSLQAPMERSTAPLDPLALALFTSDPFDRRTGVTARQPVPAARALDVPEPEGGSFAFERTALLTSGYGRVSWQDPRGWSVTPGVRLVRSTLIREGAVLPSLQAAWSRGDDGLIVRGAVGWYGQVPEIEAVAGPYGGDDLRSERARHFDLTLEHRLPASLRGAITFYDREDRDHLRLQDAEYRIVNGQLQPPATEPRYANVLNGRSRGVELFVRRDGVSGLTGWMSYAYGRMVQTDASTGESFWGDFDQRHTVNAYGLYRLSSKTSVSAKFRYGSNYPIPGYVVETDDGLVVGERRNETRLPAYVRLDLRANRAFNFKKRRMTLYVEVLNVLGRKNHGTRIGRVDADTRQVIGATTPLFPVLPSAGLLIEF